jgi:hypothetical protein
LLLHDPPAPTPYRAVKIVVEGLKIRIALADKAFSVFGGGGQPVGQKAKRVGIP